MTVAASVTVPRQNEPKEKDTKNKTATETPKQTPPLSALGAVNTTLTDHAHARLVLSLSSSPMNSSAQLRFLNCERVHLPAYHGGLNL